MSLGQLEPMMLELDEKTWETMLERTEQWFGNVLTTQSTYRHLAEDTLEKVKEPHIRAYLMDIIAKAKEHEDKAEELYRFIGRKPSRTREAAGALAAKTRQVMADLTGMAGGAAGSWRDLHQLFLVSLNAQSAFATAEQLGLALGMPEIVDVALAVSKEKFAHHRQLQELVLDMAPVAILYNMDV